MTLEEQKIKVLEDVEKFFPEELDKIRHTIENIQNEDTLTKELKTIEERIEKYKNTYTYTYYSNENNETYYADIEEDTYIYDTTKPEEEALVEKALDKATKNYLDIEPTDIHNEKEYTNFIYGDIVRDEQIGYRVIENENGLFHIIQKESSYYIYPSKRLNLSNPEHVNLCNDLFKSNRKQGFIVGDELELDGVEPAEIFMPFVAVIDDPINKITYSDVLIGEGIGLDETFKDVTKPSIENKLTKGKINVKVKTTTREGFAFQEDLINEPTKFVGGTFIPYPREQRPDELNSDYASYLETHYNNYNYPIQYDENGKPIYPHETKKEEYVVIETEETFEDKFGIDKFLSSRYNFTGNLTNLETTIIVAYLKAYKEYLKRLKSSTPESIDYIEEYLKETEEAINDIQENKVLL